MRPVLVTTALLVAVAGCTTATGGTPTPAPTSTNSAGDAPTVANPLDATPFLNRPCDALTAEQLRGFDLPAQGEPDTDSAVAELTGPSCIWQNRGNGGSTIDVHFVTGNKNGLSDTYRGHETGQFDGYWDPTTVDDYPAVFNGAIDRRAGGTCNITVGITDTLAFRVGEGGPYGSESCDRVKEMAAAVLTTIKAAN